MRRLKQFAGILSIVMIAYSAVTLFLGDVDYATYALVMAVLLTLIWRVDEE